MGILGKIEAWKPIVGDEYEQQLDYRNGRLCNLCKHVFRSIGLHRSKQWRQWPQPQQTPRVFSRRIADVTHNATTGLSLIVAHDQDGTVPRSH